ncbi:MAG TPA: DUF4234 domain-containing protein [Solirubrobacteraceae bacterium]|jgi:hypothetical protein|nr:DUF4234 domain-containing protein [Solirubrobacteraceae bacterium]
MAQTVQLGTGAKGKIRSFWVGLGLNIITLGIYYYYWYFQINEELKEIGRAKGDQELADSSPINSLIAILFGGILLLIPPLVSIYRTGKRIKRAEQLGGVSDSLHPLFSFLLVFPFGILIIPALYHYAYVTKHQNRALMAASGARV